jgi:hypothetical protein
VALAGAGLPGWQVRLLRAKPTPTASSNIVSSTKCAPSSKSSRPARLTAPAPSWRATAEQCYLAAMAALGAPPCSTAEVARALGCSGPTPNLTAP